MKDRVLGFGAVQLSHTGAGVTLDTLIAEGLFERATWRPSRSWRGSKEALGYCTRTAARAATTAAPQNPSSR